MTGFTGFAVDGNMKSFERFATLCFGEA